MSRSVAVIMYHYVRPVQASRYPGIAGLEARAFREQVDYIQRHFNVISGFDLERAIMEETALPENAALLTFDDGYLDHFTTVFPVLDAAGITGSFFPPVNCITNRHVLDVNKLHYILASARSPSAVVRRLDAEVEKRRAEVGLKPPETYWREHAKPGRYDAAKIVYVKRLLQHALPQPVRTKIVDVLFDAFVGVPEKALANELYMTTEQVQMLVRAGMHVGSHSVTHRWMNRIPAKEQAQEIDRSLTFLEHLGVDVQRGWTMCYPYGGHNASLRGLLRDRNCTVGHTIRVDVAQLDSDDPLELPRLDTNDLPKDAQASASPWLRVMKSVSHMM